MPVSITATIGHSVDRVWALIADFGGLKRWHPLLKRCEVDGPGVGCVRTVHFDDWWAKERLTSLDPVGRSIEYLVIDSSRPENVGVKASISLIDLGDGQTGLTWVSGHPDGHPDARAVNTALETYYPLRIKHLSDALALARRRTKLKIGISLPNNWGVRDADRLIGAAVCADELGFESVWMSEHLVNLAYVRARIGDGPYYHPLAMLSAIAARTTHISLATSVIVLPFHNPFDLAKYLATLDHVARGRVVLGVGVGNIPEEFDVVGVPWNRRGAITDESLEVMTRLWTQEAASYDGKVWRFDNVHTYPKPYGNRKIPVTIGGMSDAAMRRTARLGDGWQPTGITADELRTGISRLESLLVAEGRAREEVEISFRLNVALDDAVVTEHELASTIQGGDVSQMLESVYAYHLAGADHLLFALNTSNPDTLQAEIDLIARHVLPEFR